MIHDKELARIYFDHHATVTDQRSQSRLTKLMKMAETHDAKCTTPGCPLSLRGFLHGAAIADLEITEQFLHMGILEDERVRHMALSHTPFVRVRLGERFLTAVPAEEVRRAPA